MSSMIRTLQKRILNRKKVELLPVRRDHDGKTIGALLPLYRGQTCYVATDFTLIAEGQPKALNFKPTKHSKPKGSRRGTHKRPHRRPVLVTGSHVAEVA